MKHLGEYIIPQIFDNPKIDYYPMDNIQNVRLDEIIMDWNSEYGDMNQNMRRPDYFSHSIEYNGLWTLRMCYSEENSDYYEFIWGSDGHFIDFREVK